MDDNLPREQLLLKMLKMTTSDNDGTALVAIRKANKLLSEAGWDWDKLISGKIKIVENPFKNMPVPGQPAAVRRQSPPPPPPPPPRRAPQPASTSPRGGLGLTRKNNYGNHCYCCGDYVAVQDGFIFDPQVMNRSAASKWQTVCKPCNKSLFDYQIQSRPAPKNTGQTTVKAPAPNLGDL